MTLEGKRASRFVPEPVPRHFQEHDDSTAERFLIGPYRTVRLLGRGGMGEVYEAVRDTDFEQRVALKVVRSQLDTAAMIERFHAERQILARLEHPYIARLLDGGTSEDGVPYFAMELVEGERIDRYCDARRLSLRRRLELFLKICEALQFAHRHLVIHRDLKPGNILVDAMGTPKLLDFSIAKLLQGDVGYPALHEADGDETDGSPGEPLTVWFASPEQILGDPTTVASDVYSLGVLLYLLLTGRLPFASADMTSIVSRIRQERPPPPSEAVGGKKGMRPGRVAFAKLEKVAGARGTNPENLRRRLAGDLDAIVTKTLAKGSGEPLRLGRRAGRGRPTPPAGTSRQGARRHFPLSRRKVRPPQPVGPGDGGGFPVGRGVVYGGIFPPVAANPGRARSGAE